MYFLDEQDEKLKEIYATISEGGGLNNTQAIFLYELLKSADETASFNESTLDFINGGESNDDLAEAMESAVESGELADWEAEYQERWDNIEGVEHIDEENEA